MRIQLNAQQHDDEQNKEKARQERLERFLAEVTKPVAQFGETMQNEWRTEAEQHIRERARFHEDLGEDTETSLNKALREFGDARHVGQSVAKESVHHWERESVAALVRGGVGALVSVAAAILVCNIVAVWILRLFYFAPGTFYFVPWQPEFLGAVPLGALLWARRWNVQRSVSVAVAAYMLLVAAAMGTDWIGQYFGGGAPPRHFWVFSSAPRYILTYVLNVVLQGALVGMVLAQTRQGTAQFAALLGKARKKAEPPKLAR